jgi:MOSC domain-containing protein YiiM
MGGEPSTRAARLVSVNVGAVRQVTWGGRVVETGIWKEPVEGPVRVAGVNLEGDDQADRRVHGGPDKAVYAYAIEDYHWWDDRLGAQLAPGTFGENLTVSGLDVAGSLIGERWRVGTTLLEVSQPRLPCFKLGIRMGDPDFVDRFEEAQRFGAYLRIVEEGEVQAGEEVRIVSRPEHDFTITQLGLASARPDPNMIKRILSTPQVPESWRAWAERADRRRAGR